MTEPSKTEQELIEIKVGDRVRNIYHNTVGTVVAIGDWGDDFNPYKIMVKPDGGGLPENFKETHLVKEGRE